MIFVDTSVWVEFFRGGRARLAAELVRLLDDDQVALAPMVRLELLVGASTRTLTTLRRVLSALPVLYPSRDTWRLLESWVDKAVRAGQRFGAADLLVGALAAEHGARVWSLDADFARMASLKLLKLHRPNLTGDP